MLIEKQLQVLSALKPSFSEKLKNHNQYPLKTDKIDILQLNIIKKCNLFCKHCHVEAGPDREEIMAKPVLEKALELLRDSAISTLDITGGAPEMNPHLEWFLKQASQLEKRIIVRSNLVILKEKKYRKYLDIYTHNNIELCASLPDYREGKTEKQRGCGFFMESILMLKELHNRGYGKENSGLVLDLVHNPLGAFLPGNQEAIEHEYKTNLKEYYNLSFNNLFCLINMPVGRY